ncbi:hypothetical protein [Bradyrhizobium australafricanum]|uniref:hypothetical protein n=1 Tax=Bradyrhizobium australafricanum TaxID=2821406 RepID=UPI001CE2D433|nr:hypothetical protein [Bradyrhizobium australafricanum]MCA6101216.1 hypothetical protein [Bradyrhizobium australafricanum]
MIAGFSGEAPQERAPNEVGLTGVQGIGVAGEIRPAISNQVPTASVVIADSGEAHSNRTSVVRAVVLLQVDALLLVVRSEAERRRELRLNDDQDLRELEEVEARLDRVRNTTVDVERGRVQPETADEAARSLGSYVRSWFEKNHEKILSDGFDTLNGTFRAGVFVSATAICASLHVEPTLAATISGVLVGGKPVVETIKAVAKWWKDCKEPPPE